MKNTAFQYIYRDGFNFKNPGEIILLGAITPGQGKRLERAFDEGVYFIASQLSIPSVFLWLPETDYEPDALDAAAAAAVKPGEYVISEEDHCWHEFTGAAEVDQQSTDARTVEQFVIEVEAEASSAWLVFEPGTVAA